MFQQSQFSDQKNQSGYKQGVNYNEQVTNMTIRMIKKLQISSSDKNQILYFDKPITLIQLVARNQYQDEVDGKGFIVINDDSGYQKLSFLFSECVYNKEMFEMIKKEELKTIYFQFLLRARINKDTICFDIMNVKKLSQIGYLTSHMLNIILQTIKVNQITNPSILQINTQVIEEEVQKQSSSKQSLPQKILNFIKAQTHQFGLISITQQSIINEFSQTDHNLQDIKQSIRGLLENGSIQSGQGVNTYMLVD